MGVRRGRGRVAINIKEMSLDDESMETRNQNFMRFKLMVDVFRLGFADMRKVNLRLCYLENRKLY